ncbi:hypothetical protein WMY93_028942 [Mugilogobius chulae]|uniref:Uncharacterized protein n=1 Tax=Mugilogobius chulae TaxID=88201 RepID=A0AAW0N236_9GOBI
MLCSVIKVAHPRSANRADGGVKWSVHRLPLDWAGGRAFWAGQTAVLLCKTALEAVCGADSWLMSQACSYKQWSRVQQFGESADCQHHIHTEHSIKAQAGGAVDQTCTVSHS